MPTDDAREIVKQGYALASHAYRGDAFPLAGSAYEYWYGRFVARLGARSRVLDLGCGNGLPVARELVDAGHRVTGVDLSEVQIARARELVPGAEFVCADMAALELEPESFDGVAAFYSLINLPLAEQPVLLERIARSLVPGGWLIATVGQEPWTGTEENWRGVRGARMYYSHAGVAQYREWFGAGGLTLIEQGREPKHGNPGYAMFLAQRPPT